MRLAFTKLFALALIIGSMVFAFLIFTNDSSVLSSVSPAPSSTAAKARSENVPDSASEIEKNLTAQAAQAISEQISLPEVQSPEDLRRPEEVAEAYLTESAKNFDFESLKPRVDASQLKIVPTTDQRLLSIYAKGLQDVMRTAVGSAKLDDTEMGTNLAILSAAYGKTIEALYAMPIPEMFGQLHRDIIANLGGQKTATEMIRQNFQTDPVRSLLALDAISKLNQELTLLQNTVAKLTNTNS